MLMRWKLKGGQVIHAHDPELSTPPCAVHSPSEHRMRDWPQLWRTDRGLMERICACEVGHPDPDHLGYVMRTRGADAAETEAIHGCCGCCRAVARN